MDNVARIDAVLGPMTQRGRWFGGALAAAALACSLAIASPPAEEPGPRYYDEAALEGPRATIPMDLYGGRPVISARFNGGVEHRFVIDIGSSGSMIDAELARSLELPVVGRNTFGDPKNPEAFTTDTVRIRQIDMGPVSFSGVRADTFDMSVLWQGEDAPAGIIGIDLFAEFLLTLDHPGRSFVVERGSLPEPDGEAVLAYELENGIPEVPIIVAGRTWKAHLDSGSPAGFTFPGKHMQSLPLKSDPIEGGRARTVAGVSTIYRSHLDGMIRIGGYEIQSPSLSFHDLVEIPNVGMEVLDKLSLTFDQRHRRIAVKPVEEPAPAIGPGPP